MAELKEVKPRSFRIDDDTYKKIQEIASDIGSNQNQVFSKLLECYEFQSGKVAMGESRGDIETFENYVTSLTRMYMNTLENSRNIAENVRVEYDGLLQSKDNTIRDLQERARKNQEETSQAKQETSQAIKEMEIQRQNVAVLEKQLADDTANYTEIIKDKESLNHALGNALDNMKKEVQAAVEEKAAYDKVRKELEETRGQLAATKEKQRELQEQYNKMQLDHERELLEQEKAYHSEVAALQTKYVSMLEEKIKTPTRRSNRKKETVEEPKKEITEEKNNRSAEE